MERENEILKIISNSIKEENSEKRNELENQINSFLENVDVSLPLLIKIFHYEQTTPSIKKYIGILLTKIKYQLVNDTNIINFVNFCFDVIFDEKTTSDQKKDFCDFLERALIMEEKTIKREDKKRVKVIFFEKLKEKSNDVIDEERCINLLLVLEILYKTFEKQDFVKIVILTNFILDKIKNDFIPKNILYLESDKFNLSKIVDNSIGKKCNQILFLFENFVLVFKKVIKKLSLINLKTRVIYFRDLMENFSFLELFQNIFLMTVGNLTKDKSNILFNITDFSELNNKLNLIKKESLTIITSIYSYYSSTVVFKNKNFLQIFRLLCKIIIESFYNYFVNPKTFFIIKNDSSISRLMQTSIEYIIKLMRDNETHELFIYTKKKLFVDIILPNLVCNQEEIAQLEDEAEEFVNSTIEQLYHNSSCLKGKLGDFLENLSENIDGFLSYIVKFCCNMIRFSIEKGDENMLKEMGIFDDLQNTKFFTETSAENKVESCLLVLTIVKSKVETRDDLLHYLDVFLKRYYNFLVNSTKLIQTRFIFFISDYLSLIPKADSIENDKKGINNLKIELMAYLLSVSGGEGAVSFAALKNLDIFSRESLHRLNKKDFTEKLAYPFLNIICKKIEEENQVTGDIVCLETFIKENKQFFIENENIFNKILLILIKRIIVEEQFNNSHKQIKIASIWKILEFVIEEKKFIKFFSFIDQHLNELLQIMVDGKIKSWDQNFFSVLLNLIYHTRCLPICAQNVFFTLPIIIKSYDNNLLYCFHVINSFLFYFPNFFNLDKIISVLNMIEVSIVSALKQDENTKKNYLSDSLFLLQILIQTQGTKMNEGLIMRCKNIYETFFNNLKNGDLDIFFYEKIEGILLSMFISIPDISWNLFSDQIRTISYSLPQNCMAFETLFEKKLLVLGMISIFDLLIKNLCKEYEIYTDILNFLIPYMKFIQNHQVVELYHRRSLKIPLNHYQKEFENLEKVLINCLHINESGYNWFNSHQFDEKDNEDEDIKRAYLNTNIKNQLTNKIYSNIFTIDEYFELHKILEKLKNQHKDFFKDLKNHLSPVTLRYIDSVVINTRYLMLSKDPEILRARMIRKIKKN